MPPPLDPAKRAAILADIQAGNASCRGIARAHDVSRTTVSQIAKDAGLNEAFGRQQTKKATEAAQVDHKARLVAIASRAAGITENIAASLEGMTVEDWSAVSPYSRGLIFGIMADKARELAADDDDSAQIASLLGDLFDQLTDRHGTGE